MMNRISKRNTLNLAMLAALLLVGACAAPSAAPAASSAGAEMASAPAEMASAPAESSTAMTETHSMDASPAMTDSMAAEDTAAESAEAGTDAEEAGAADSMAADSMAAAVELPAWASLPLVNAQTGATFTLADSAGKTIFVEPFATWCSNCRSQLTTLTDVASQYGDDVVFVALSVETNLAPADVAAYAASNGFDWTFAAMTPEVLQALGAVFGPTVGNPPATPHFIIRPDGSVTDLVTGLKSADELVEFIESNRG
jgi:thiol-disulfide isomerase/thioredoxin